MKDVEKMTSCCHHGTFGTAWPANRNAALRACMLHDRQGRVDFKCIFNWKLGSMLNANINLIANKMKQQSDSTDLSLCKWPRAHFTYTEGLLLGVSTVNTHHSEGREMTSWVWSCWNPQLSVTYYTTDPWKRQSCLKEDVWIPFLPVTAESGNILPKWIPGHPLHVALMVIQDTQFLS